ncbi:MAG: FAD-dependent oxidoreductase [Planctomycetota bacterium]|nr:FAD-dependent oxidoreductase [Planctomycetota bacterium]
MRHSAVIVTTLSLAVSPFIQTPAVAQEEVDVVVYGGTSAGVIAAVQAKKMGKTAVIVGPDKHLGGLSSGGLGFTDSGRKETIGGLSRDFYHRLWAHYQEPSAWKWQKQSEFGNRGQGTPAIDGTNRTMWVFEPHMAETVFDELVAEFEIPVFREERLDREKGVKKEGDHIAAITMLSGKTLRGKVFIDATYEGDLMAAAGVTYTVGREANAKHGETINGVQKANNTHSHRFVAEVDPYVKPGDANSGTVWGVHDGDPGTDGEADKRVQAYCYRMCMSNVKENSVPFPKPADYDEATYELLFRNFEAGDVRFPMKPDMLPNGKTDTNNNCAFSTDALGMNYDYPEASYEEREKILAAHVSYQQGLMWSLANHPRVPRKIRDEMAKWGLAKDEFTDNANWPHQIYVREARRMVGDYVQTKQDCRRIRVCDDSIGLGSYNMDSHNAQRYVTADGKVQNEGDIQVSPGGPYAISYRSIVPKKGEVANLLVPICLSSSHIAYGSIRMEPVFMILGQDAATAAVLAIDANSSVQDVPYDKLRDRLLADGQILDIPEGTQPATAALLADSLEGIVVDDAAAVLKGEWSAGNTIGPWVGAGYRHDGDEGKGAKSATFTAKLKPGRYEVRLAYSPHSNRATNVPVVVRHASGEKRVTVDQRKPPKLAKAFTSLGTFTFGETGIVEVLTELTNGHVIIDAVQFLPVK